MTMRSFCAPALRYQIVFIATLVCAVYMFAPQAQFLTTDDASLSYGNPIVREFDLHGAFTTYDPELYIPLTLLSYQIEYAIFGADPAAYHTTNVVLHLLNAILVLLLVRFFVRGWSVPFLTAILFAAHPLNTEAVMWVSGRKDLLSAMFFFGSLLSYCHFRTGSARRYFYGSVMLFVCALLTKVVTVTLPLVLILIDDLLPKPEENHEKLSKWIFYLPALVFLYLAMLRKFISIYTVSYFEAALIAMKSVFFYLEKLLLPTKLSMFYQQDFPISILQSEFAIPLLALVLLAIITIESRKLGKLFSFGILWFGVTVLPNLGNAAKGSKSAIFFASDRYAYIASVGILLLMSIGLTYAWKYLRPRIGPICATLCVALVPTGYALAAHCYSYAWLTPKANAEHTLKNYPNTAMSHMILGIQAFSSDDLQAAQTHFETSAHLSEHFAHPWAQLGLVLAKQDRFEEALTILEDIEKRRPDHPNIYTYLGYVHMLSGDDRTAEGYLLQAITTDPDEPTALQLLGTLRQREGNVVEAERYLRQAIAKDPKSVRAKAALASLLRQ